VSLWLRDSWPRAARHTAPRPPRPENGGERVRAPRRVHARAVSVHVIRAASRFHSLRGIDRVSELPGSNPGAPVCLSTRFLHVGGWRDQFRLARTDRETIPTAIGAVEGKLGNCATRKA
jgi:hypothetical protein